MEYTFDDLKHSTVAQLRDIAKGIEHEAVQGYTQLNKQHLLEAICKALNIDMHVHHDVIGLDKKKIKKELVRLKGERDKALEAHDLAKLKEVRTKRRLLKKRLTRALD